LAHAAVLHRIPAGSLIFEQAETPAFAQFLLEGSVELVRPVDLLLPAAVLNRRPYLLRARVFEDARLLMVRADGFRQAVAAGHDLCLAILACQAAQFRRMVKQAKNLRLRPAEDRVGCYLLRLAEQTDPGQPIRLPKEKRLIASELGMTQETFSRSLALVIQHGLRVEGDLVVVEDFAAARTRFPLDPQIDDPEHLAPLTTRRKLLWKHFQPHPRGGTLQVQNQPEDLGRRPMQEATIVGANQAAHLPGLDCLPQPARAIRRKISPSGTAGSSRCRRIRNKAVTVAGRRQIAVQQAQVAHAGAVSRRLKSLTKQHAMSRGP
jgi:CRP/FNR family transcriptional regulator, transcriptional activator FtrB